jgi:hypothetical protein
VSMNTPFHLRQREFNEFNAANPEVWQHFERFTMEAIQAGHRKISHWLIINRIRWEVMITTTGGDYKISNDHIAFYARLFVKVHPQYRFIFNLKRMRDEPWHEDMPL